MEPSSPIMDSKITNRFQLLSAKELGCENKVLLQQFMSHQILLKSFCCSKQHNIQTINAELSKMLLLLIILFRNTNCYSFTTTSYQLTNNNY